MIQQIEIEVFSKDRKPVGFRKKAALIIGPMMVHRPTDVVARAGTPFVPMRGWRVTHIASGRNVFPAPICCFAHAKALAVALEAAHLHWPEGKLENSGNDWHAKFPAKFVKDMMVAQQICYAMGSTCQRCKGNS